MPGLFSTQSVHKQGAGFSQASQIHKRDDHIRGQQRYVEHKRFNESFLMNASTSPFYPLFASLDVNAKIHEGKAGEMLWDRCIELGIETRKKLREFGGYYAQTGQSRSGAVVLRSLRARRRHDPRLEIHRGCHRRRLGGSADRGDQARAAVLELPALLLALDYVGRKLPARSVIPIVTTSATRRDRRTTAPDRSLRSASSRRTGEACLRFFSIPTMHRSRSRISPALPSVPLGRSLQRGNLRVDERFVEPLVLNSNMASAPRC